VEEAVIIDAVRTPVGRGKAGGGLADVHPVDLLAGVLRALADRTGIDPALLDDVLVGCVQQVGEQSGNIARGAALAAGFPESVPGATINRQCGSSQQGAMFAAQAIMAGTQDMVIAAGVESMSAIPLGSARPASSGHRITPRYPSGLVHQGVSAELVADRWQLSRGELDEYSAQSHHRAATAWESGHFAGEVIAVPEAPSLGRDETVRLGTTAEGLAALRPSFRTSEFAARFPELDWKITPGNSSPLTDGASGVLICSAMKARQLGLRPRARFLAFSVTGDDPLLMLTGPIPATRKILRRTGLTINDLDAYEVNEAFAPVPLVWMREFGADPGRLNAHGGAIALGHALGSSGTRLLTTLLNTLESRGGRFGLQTMCEAGGMANATIIERL
jgi:acetyl-CoA acyltransferase